MRLIQNLLFALTAFSFAAGAAAQATPKDGFNYHTIPTPLPTEAGKVEVIEFFAYSCPHCDSFDPVLTEWVKKQGSNIAFKRVHVAFRQGDVPLQRLHATLDAMGVLEQSHSKIFKAIHGDQRMRFSNDEDVFNWVEKNGVNRAQFIATYRSFGMQANVGRANRLAGDYRIEQWPMIAVGGRYVTSPYHAGGQVDNPPSEAEQQKAALAVMDYLVAKAKAAQK